LANTLCGEPMTETSLLQRLSGGQTRALMIADIALVSDAPVVLIDEVENAGIDKHLAVETLGGHGKITVIATHDPVLMLSSPKRLVMAMGGMRRLYVMDEAEKRCREKLETLDRVLLAAREHLRRGERLQEAMFA
jgi:ABC-type antimicrobial peptide transport system, ATPase component